MAETIVVIPTYNEIDGLEAIVGRMRQSMPDVDLLIVDDASPDGTGRAGRSARRGRLRDRGAAPRGQGGARQGVPRRFRARPRAAATTASSSWMPTDRTIPPSCRSCSTSPRRPTSSSVPGGCAGVRSATGRGSGRRSRAPATPTRAGRCGPDIRDITAGYRVYTADALRSLDLTGCRLAGLLLPDRAGLAARTRGQADRGASDRVRGTSDRTVEDAPRDRARGAVQGDRMGDRGSPSQRARLAEC